ncbi:hypothetical protein BDV27DRAFT_132231 [Aspergillus caelatus]|uniref:Uncharacterized protein n=1 Tax=Aspergillus caelatus TaxID=61420 RepID=A0A5N6ZX93_9EURO|nr:uncharacterized protein BDV27DRAFT_132231 [Aspergillus caelatus]KAE8361978.1 hypothetical protein BDV27DRAFT_132231 [Aspergillus caelatus]
MYSPEPGTYFRLNLGMYLLLLYGMWVPACVCVWRIRHTLSTIKDGRSFRWTSTSALAKVENTRGV